MELKTTLRITKPLILTTDCGATLKPASDFIPGQVLEDGKMVTKNCLIHVDGHNSSDIGRPGSIGKLKIGEEVTTDPDNIITLDGGNRFKVVYCEMRGSPAGPWQTLVLNAGIITNGSSTSGAGLHLDRASKFIMNGGSIINNNVTVTSDFQYSADIWVGSGVGEATINGGTVGKMLVRSWKGETGTTYAGTVTISGGSVDTVYLDHHYNSTDPSLCKGSALTYAGGSISHVLVGDSKNTYNNHTTFRHSEVYQSALEPLPFGVYTGGTHVAKVGEYGYKTLEEAINAAKDGDKVTIIGDCDLTSAINVTKNISVEVGEYKFSGTKSYVFTNNDNLSFNVTLNLNGGSANIPSEWTDMGDGTYFRSYLYGTSFSDVLADLDSVTPSKYSFDFGSWAYAVGGHVGIDGTRIQAMWDPVYYTVTFDANGGTIGQTNVTVRAGEAIGSIPETTYDGHTFMGWFTENGDKVTSETQVTSDMIIKADWEETVIIDDPYQGGLELPGTNDDNGSEEPGFTIPIAVAVVGILEILGLIALNRFF